MEQLARYWAAAAVPARHIDEDFAELCLYKSEAWWVNPEEWDSKKIEQYGIDIESVKNKYQAMLLNKPE